MGAPGRDGLARRLRGAPAEYVLRHAPCPALLVPPDAAAEVGFGHILCPMDFSPASLHALDMALELARHSNSVVTVLLVIDRRDGCDPREYSHFTTSGFTRQLLDTARMQLRTLMSAKAGTWKAYEERVVAGYAGDEILQVASDCGTDLIVMGAHEREGLGLALFGSTMQRVARAASCPVMTVRGPAGRRPL
jgi:nucleotide-binding universal stress UspA family protein